MKLHNQDLGPFRIFAEGLDEDGIEFVKGAADYYGVDFPDPDREGITVFVPWARVKLIEAGAEPVADPEDPEPVSEQLENPNEVPPGAVVPPPVEPEAKPGDKGKAEPKDAGKAREWAEDDPAKIRAWAKENNVEVADSGTIPKSVLSKYAAAHSD